MHNLKYWFTNFPRLYWNLDQMGWQKRKEKKNKDSLLIFMNMY